jgi:hypothetical protein
MVAGNGSELYRHTAVQRYVVNVYGRYLLGNKRIKKLKIMFTGNEGIDLYKRVEITESVRLPSARWSPVAAPEFRPVVPQPDCG